MADTAEVHETADVDRMGEPGRTAGDTGRTAGDTGRTAGDTGRTAGDTGRTAGDTGRTAGEPRPGAGSWLPTADGADDAVVQVDRLRAAAPACRGCELWEPASQVVFSAGAATARIALVGEQPGDVEDQRGIPFVGPAGRLLQRAVDEAGLARGDLYVTNAVKHFRFAMRGQRRIHQTPDVAHIAACRPWLQAELRAVDPQVVVLLGATATRALLGPGLRVGADRGRLISRDTSRGRKHFLITVHPSAVLRVPEEQRQQAYGALVDDLRVVTGLLAEQQNRNGSAQDPG